MIKSLFQFPDDKNVSSFKFIYKKDCFLFFLQASSFQSKKKELNAKCPSYYNH